MPGCEESSVLETWFLLPVLPRMTFYLHLLFGCALDVSFTLLLLILSGYQLPLLCSVSFIVRIFILPTSSPIRDAEFEHSLPWGWLVLELPSWGLPGVKIYHIFGNTSTDKGKKLLGEHFQTLSVMQPFDWLVQFQLEHFASGTVDVRNPMFVITGWTYWRKNVFIMGFL